MNTSQKILFFGTEDFSAASLRALIDAGFTVAAVVTKPDTPKGRGHKLHEPEVKQIADSHGIPVLQPSHISEIEPFVRSLQPVAGVLVSYGKIIPERIIDLFTPGIINVHPSLLPKYRGPSPIESAILNGDAVTGISIMRLTKAMDAGPVYAQTATPLKGSETGPSLSLQLAEFGADELVKHLGTILDGTLAPTEQDDGSATYCSLLSKSDSELKPDSMTAEQAERHVRAYLSYPRSRANINGTTVIVTKAHVQNTPSSVSIKCNNDQYLAIDELVAPSGKTMSAEAFERGYLNK